MAASETEQFLGKVVIVTGASSGFGEAMALTFAKYVAKVTICGRNVTRIQEVKNKCIEVSGGHPERFLTVCGDVRDQEIRSQIVNDTVAKFGQLDILVCNAGVNHPENNIRQATEQIFDRIFDINVKSVFFQIQTALPHLEKSKGNIVLISSIGSTLAWSPMIIYPMSKAAVDHMANCLALDLAPKGIRVNTVNQSYAMTRIARDLVKDEDDTKLRELAEVVRQTEEPKQPLGNRLVTVEEVAEGAAFLASDKASFITGQHLYVDGGRTLTGPLLV